jgi:hypothetical protein
MPPPGNPYGPTQPYSPYPVPPTPPRKKSSSGLLWVAAGCGVLIVFGGLVAVLVGGGLLFSLKGVGIGSKVEKVEYKEIRDSSSGPSDVVPSGRSSSTFTIRNGVIETSAKEIHTSEEIVIDNEGQYCKSGAKITDILKGFAFNIDRELRKSAPLSEAEEVALGVTVSQQVAKEFGPALDRPDTAAWRAYIARIAQPMLAELKRKKVTYHFHVIDKNVVNAFAIPGGHVYFYTGLLTNNKGTWVENEAQLASIVAHEISHIDLGHTIAIFQYLKRLGGEKAAPAAIVLRMARHSFSSNQEDESDLNAVNLLYKTQYAPDEMPKMWANWGRQQGSKSGSGNVLKDEIDNLLRSHSAPEVRACNTAKETNKVAKLNQFDRFYVGKSNLKKRKARLQKQY